MEHLLACPLCKKRLDSMSCKACNVSFAKTDNVYSLICREMYPSVQAYDTALQVMDFWGNGWKKRLQEPDHKFIFEMDQAALIAHAAERLESMRNIKALMGVEVPMASLPGKTVLNIGCGAGGEALLLSRAGANCIAMDITSPAAEAAQTLIQRSGGNGIGIQADARFIPLEDASVDMVYSSGVIHHSPDIAKSIAEIHRVLKPGGIACIMLYATWSIVFMQEKLMRWPGEAAWETEGRKNPCTTTYSAAQCREMFSAFDSVQIRKHGASLGHVAKIGRYLPKIWDKRLDSVLGSNLNILAVKG